MKWKKEILIEIEYSPSVLFLVRWYTRRLVEGVSCRSDGKENRKSHLEIGIYSEAFRFIHFGGRWWVEEGEDG